jgi:SAM-dependent methyltransferase
MDADRYRVESQQRWERQAAGWTRRREQVERFGMPVAQAMIEMADPQPGEWVLDIAAGTGETGLLVAEMVRPGGRVLITDFSEEMVAAAKERARQLGADNVEVRVLDAESMAIDAAQIDLALCRWGYMLMADPETALRETRRILKPGGRLVLAAWGEAEENPWASLMTRALKEAGAEVAVDAPGAPGMFALGAPGQIEALLDAAGFLEHRVERLAFEATYRSLAEWIAISRDLGSRMAEVLETLDDDAAERFEELLERETERWRQPDGSLRIPAVCWIARADA